MFGSHNKGLIILKIRLKKWIDEFQVTNDAAERAVKNAQEMSEVT